MGSERDIEGMKRVIPFWFSKLRSVGVKSADELYKSVNMAVRESGELRVQHEAATRELKEACGLQPVSNIKQVGSA